MAAIATDPGRAPERLVPQQRVGRQRESSAPGHRRDAKEGAGAHAWDLSAGSLFSWRAKRATSRY